MRIVRKVRKLAPYVHGEQPRGRDVIKLNTNEAAYKPPFAVKTSLKNFSMSRDVRSLPLYVFGRWIGRWIFGD